MSLAAAKRYSARLNDKSNPVTWGELARAAEAIDNRLVDELKAIQFFVLDPDRAKYFESPTPLLGQAVEEKLPSSIRLEIEDAGRCLALGLGTAAVFHLMRILEFGLKELAKMLDIAYAPGWEPYIDQIKARIKTRDQQEGVGWKIDKAFLSRLLGDFQVYKEAWRNPTMHGERYSIADAENALRAVRSFLQRLAPHLPTLKDVDNKASRSK
jgi:hypothetical protein